MRRRLTYGLLAIMFGIIAFTVWQNYGPKTDQPTRLLSIDGTVYRLEIAATPEQQARGLSGRRGLLAGDGMLFANTGADERCIWMKDMQFPIDIIWVNTDKTTAKVMSNVQPDTYPQTFCAEAQYVIELKAGEAARHGLETGQPLQF